MLVYCTDVKKKKKSKLPPPVSATLGFCFDWFYFCHFFFMYKMCIVLSIQEFWFSSSFITQFHYLSACTLFPYTCVGLRLNFTNKIFSNKVIMVSEQTKIICYKYEGKTSWFDVSRIRKYVVTQKEVVSTLSLVSGSSRFK